MHIRTHRRNVIAGSLGLVLASGRLGARAATSPLYSSEEIRFQQQTPDWKSVAQALGAPGQLMDGDVFRIGMLRTDLKVTAKGVTLLPAFALGSYAAFKQMGDQTMVMGDLVLLDEEVNPVMSGLFDAGFTISGLHNHLSEMTPHVMYLHYMGMGEPVQLAKSLRQALSASATPLGKMPVATPMPAATPMTDLPDGPIGQVLGRKTKIAKGGGRAGLGTTGRDDHGGQSRAVANHGRGDGAQLPTRRRGTGGNHRRLRSGGRRGQSGSANAAKSRHRRDGAAQPPSRRGPPALLYALFRDWRCHEVGPGIARCHRPDQQQTGLGEPGAGHYQPAPPISLPNAAAR